MSVRSLAGDCRRRRTSQRMNNNTVPAMPNIKPPSVGPDRGDPVWIGVARLVEDAVDLGETETGEFNFEVEVN